MISVHFQGKPSNIPVIQVYAPSNNAKEVKLNRRPTRASRINKIDVLFIIGDWNAKVRRKEIPGVTGKLGRGVQKEAGQRLIEFCQEKTLVIANTLLQQHKRRFYTWTSPDG